MNSKQKRTRTLTKNIFKPIAIVVLIITLIACDSSDESVSAQSIGFEGKWESYCDSTSALDNSKRSLEVNGANMKERVIYYSELSCTGGEETKIYSSTFNLKASVTTPSGLTAYPMDKVDSKGFTSKQLIVIQGSTLYVEWLGIENYPDDISSLAHVYRRTK